jgi:diguanylate cyclase (GGDEF)-like protein
MARPRLLASAASIERLRDAFEEPYPFEVCKHDQPAEGRVDVVLLDEALGEFDAGEPIAWCRLALGGVSCECDASLSPTADAETWRTVVTLALEIACVRKELASARRQADALHSQANSDPLTGLANRRGWDQTIQSRIAATVNDSVTILVFDLDRFKDCNDRHGHAFGDQVLVETANLLKQSLRQSDLVARVGGDEFAALLDRITVEDVFVTSERIRQQICDSLGRRFAAAAPTVSLGACSGRIKEHDVLVAKADQALMRAKQAGRNRCEIANHDA